MSCAGERLDAFGHSVKIPNFGGSATDPQLRMLYGWVERNRKLNETGAVLAVHVILVDAFMDLPLDKALASALIEYVKSAPETAWKQVEAKVKQRIAECDRDA